MKRAKANWHIVQRYQREKWYLMVILFFILVWLVLQLFKEPIISPLSDNPYIPQAYAAEPNGLRESVLLQVMRTMGVDQVAAFDKIVFKESSWNPKAVNPSGAYGLYQALPFGKTGCNREDIGCQTEWAMKYMKDRYGSAVGAYNFHLSHGWY